MSTHYETLGINESASADEIKNAYRKLAMQWHPDRNNGDPAAEAKFKEINSAYETLSDPTKRGAYDQERQASQNFGGSHMRWNVNFSNGGFDDIISQIFAHHNFNFSNQPARNRDINLAMNISLEDAFNGKQVPIQFNTNSGRRVEIVVNIPPGVDSGVKIRYQGQGDHANTAIPPGDLYIQINVVDHAIFHRRDANLETHINVDAIGSIVGTKHKITGIDGQQIEIKIPAGTQAGTRLKISGKGMPVRPNANERGDLIAIVAISIPTSLSEPQLDSLRQLQLTRGLDTL